MKKRIRKFVAVALSLMLMTPVFTAPKLPVIPNISGNISIPQGATEAAKKAGQEAAKKIDWSKCNFNFKF